MSRHLTQLQMARDLKVTQATMSAVELGQDPSLPFLRQLADSYGLDERELREIAGVGSMMQVIGNNTRRAELLTEFEQLSDEDQDRVLVVARAFNQMKPKVKPKGMGRVIMTQEPKQIRMKKA